MPRYVNNARQRFQHELPKKPEHQPYSYALPANGAKRQYAKETVTYMILGKQEKTFVQQVVGVFLFYGRAVDGNILCPLKVQ